ncbi:MAG: D-aminoacyl-tRNA deacylase [Crocinitomicaceae bacterium]|nr:D-aminoacyl-tRNA deacylase [Crocinitomicaceae bacterium]MDG1775994.1 D-aminoacyl-tRNA deacylase [Crocinitomicaceae bacterium]
MRLLVQRVNEASVKIDTQINGEINQGLLLFLGIGEDDHQEDIDWLIQKVVGLRIFSDEHGKMNLSSSDVDAEFLVISQFTLHASTKKGNRPSYIKAAKPGQAIPLYESFIKQLKSAQNQKVASGIFGTDMKVSLINDGPVTIWIDSKNKQ